MASASKAALAEDARPDIAEDPSEFPGCRPVRVTPADLDDYHGRFEYWDRDTQTAFVVREPTSVYHEGPGQRLATLLTRISEVRGAPILTLGTSDLALRDERGERRRIMQADQIVYLDPAETRPRGPWVEVGSDHLPDVVLEVDYSTDVRRGKLGLYEAWGFPEVWVEVPAVRLAPSAAGPDDSPPVGGRLPGGGGERRPAGLDGGGDSRRAERAGAVGVDARRARACRPRAGRGRGHRPRRRLVARRAAPRSARGGACARTRGGACARSCAGACGRTCGDRRLDTAEPRSGRLRASGRPNRRRRPRHARRRGLGVPRRGGPAGPPGDAVPAGGSGAGRRSLISLRPALPSISETLRRPLVFRRRPVFCSTQAWSFFRYGLDRVSSMPCSSQKPISTSLRNSLPLSVSIPRSGNGRAPRSRSTASTTTPASRTSSGARSVQPLAMSVSTSVQTKPPAIDDPQCATRSASTKPGAGSCGAARR